MKRLIDETIKDSLQLLQRKKPSWNQSKKRKIHNERIRKLLPFITFTQSKCYLPDCGMHVEVHFKYTKSLSLSQWDLMNKSLAEVKQELLEDLLCELEELLK